VRKTGENHRWPAKQRELDILQQEADTGEMIANKPTPATSPAQKVGFRP
jgi:hypothetical protein